MNEWMNKPIDIINSGLRPLHETKGFQRYTRKGSFEHWEYNFLFQSVLLFIAEREGGGREGGRDRQCVCVCVCVRERERERERSVSVSVSVRYRIQMTGDENGVGGRVRFLAYRLVVIGVFFNFGFEGRNGL